MKGKSSLYMYEPVELTRKLIQFDTVNPPGNEKEIALFIGDLILENGFAINYHVFEENRLHLIAEKGVSPEKNPIVFSGHLDVVPLGTRKWDVEPFSGEIVNGKIFGRGSSDMKGGVAAMLVAAIEAFNENPPVEGIRIVLTAGEELGCQGATQLVSTYHKLGKAKAIIIAEPTSNNPIIGHKGGLYLNISIQGISAHSSMPELGDNAIYKAAHAITKIEQWDFSGIEDSILGVPTINVGKITGGQNLNSVPDHAEFTIDFRSTEKTKHSDVIDRLKMEFGSETNIEVLVDLPPVINNEDDPFLKKVYKMCKPFREDRKKVSPYLTDGSVLQPYYGGIPTIILGPGEPEKAHQINEFCYIDKIIKAKNIYKNILLNGSIRNEEFSG